MQRMVLMMAVVVMMNGEGVWGHGRMMEPVQRSSIWRKKEQYPGHNFEPNYNDNQLFCGGKERQWNPPNNGKCGTCGDPYDAPYPHPNEASGKYATGVIVANYTQGQTIEVTVEITANHKGYFVFKLCPNNDVTQRATQECLDQHVLKAVLSNGTMVDKFYIDDENGNKYVLLQLPSDIICTQCVLQWTYNAGNSWGCSTDDNDDSNDDDGCCVGCGRQENFVNCADIGIYSSDGVTNAPTISGPSTTTDTTTVQTTTLSMTISTSTAQSTTTTTTTSTTTGSEESGGSCRATGAYVATEGMDNWCQIHCNWDPPYCPPSHCVCD